MTTRDPDALLIQKWAATGDVATPESRSLVRATGWPIAYSQPGGNTPSRQVFNQMFREITGMLDEINRKGGILPWDAAIAYEHPAYVIREVNNNPRIFESLRDNTNSDPATFTDWISPIPQAGAYVAQLHSVPSTLTDFNDINTTLFNPVQSEVIWFHDNVDMVDNRPFGVATTQRFECLLMRSPLSDQLVLKAFPANRSVLNLAGITCFERYSNDNGSTWTQWGTNPALSTAYSDRANQLNPFFRRASNCINLERNSHGNYTLTIPHAPPVDETEGFITGVHVTAFHSGVFRNAQIVSIVDNVTNGLDVTFQIYDNNSGEVDVTNFSFIATMPAV